MNRHFLTSALELIKYSIAGFFGAGFWFLNDFVPGLIKGAAWFLESINVILEIVNQWQYSIASVQYEMIKFYYTSRENALVMFLCLVLYQFIIFWICDLARRRCGDYYLTKHFAAPFSKFISEYCYNNLPILFFISGLTDFPWLLCSFCVAVYIEVNVHDYTYTYFTPRPLAKPISPTPASDTSSSEDSDPELQKVPVPMKMIEEKLNYLEGQLRLKEATIKSLQRKLMEEEDRDDLEMATGSRVYAAEEPKNICFITTQLDDTHDEFVGTAFAAATTLGAVLFTAAHNISGGEEVSIRKGGRAVNIPTKEFKYFGKDGAYFVLNGTNIQSSLGLRTLKIGFLDLSAPVKIIGSDGRKFFQSTGKIDRTEPPKAHRTYYSNYHSEPGYSGSPIMQNDKIVGFHSGATEARGLNFFQTLFKFADRNHYRGSNSTRLRDDYESSIANSRDYEEDFTWSDLADLRATSKDNWTRGEEDYFGDELDKYTSWYGKLQWRARNYVEEGDQVGARDVFAPWRELDAEMQELEEQGYSMNSRQAKAARERFYAKYESKRVLFQRAAPTDYNRGEVSEPPHSHSTTPEDFPSSNLLSMIRSGASELAYGEKLTPISNPPLISRKKPLKSSATTTGAQTVPKTALNSSDSTQTAPTKRKGKEESNPLEPLTVSSQ